MTKRKHSAIQSSTPAATAGPSTSVASLQASMAALGTGPVTATGPCPKKQKTKATTSTDFDVEITPATIKFVGRPDFAKAATDIKVVAGQQDRRHVLGYDDAIRPTFEFAVNAYRDEHGDAALVTKLRALNQAAGMKGVPHATKRPLKDHLKYSLSQLNSSPGNLNPELASENQAIEHVRQQSQHARKALDKLYVDPDKTPDVAAAKKTLLDIFEPSKNSSGTAITDFANEARTVVSDRIKNATTNVELYAILSETETSTGIDLSKRAGAKTQTSYSLQLANDLRNARDPEFPMSSNDRLEAIYKVRKTPDQSK
jgi:hypothetical protein